jgi:hypothetical protein
MGILACRTYAVICFFYGVVMTGGGSVFLYWAVFGMPPLVAGVPTSIAIPESERSYLPWVGGQFLIVGPIFIAVGLFAYSRYISAMIVGCLIWMYLLVTPGDSLLPAFRTWRALLHGDIDFYVIQFLAFVLLTAIGAIAARRSRSP